MARGGPWTDEDTLREEYVEKGKTRAELAEQWDCAEGTIQYWQEKHGIERRDVGGADKDAPYRDKDILQRLYYEEGKSLQDMADQFGCSVFAIQRWMDKHGLERRMAPNYNDYPPYHGFRESPDGGIGQVYEIVSTRIDGDNYAVPVHRLIAVAHGILEPFEMWEQSIDIHHDSGHGLDNRPSNLQRMSKGEHIMEHKPWESR